MNLSSDQGLGTGDLESGRDFAYSEEEPAPDLEERFTFTAKNMFDFKVLAPPVTNEGLQHGDLEDDEEEDEEYGYTANRAPQHFDDQKDYYCPTPTATPPSGRSSDGKTRAAAIAFLKSSSSHRTSAMLNSNDSTSKGKFKTRMAPSSPETRTRREPRVSDGADADLSGITDDD